MGRLENIDLALRKRALAYPEAWEDTPWEGDVVAKVRKKVFVFFGSRDGIGVTVKVPESAPAILQEPWSDPAGYGLGRSGWVSCSFTDPDDVPVDLLEDLIDESYRNVAPKTLVRKLDEV